MGKVLNKGLWSIIFCFTYKRTRLQYFYFDFTKLKTNLYVNSFENI